MRIAGRRTGEASRTKDSMTLESGHTFANHAEKIGRGGEERQGTRRES